jgi:outer membrane protein insertion porin family
VLPDVTGLVRVRAGNITGWGGQDVRMLDNFQMGGNLVRGFAVNGIGPRDLTPGTFNDAVGGTMFWAATAEVQTPLYFLPKEIGIKLAGFVDAGSLWDYQGPTYWAADNEHMYLNGSNSGAPIRASAGIGLLWDSPVGPIRFDFAFPFMKQSYDRTQWFRFSGGTSF